MSRAKRDKPDYLSSSLVALKPEHGMEVDMDQSDGYDDPVDPFAHLNTGMRQVE